MVSDEDIERYNLPFPKGGGRWWTRDAERDYYLWGGLVGNLAYDEIQEGSFDLFKDGIIYTITLRPGKGSGSLKDIPFVIRWEKILDIQPDIDNAREKEILIKTLKEALTTYGFDGERNTWPKSTQVTFHFN